MEKKSITINGRTFDYLDVVHHTTTTKFGFWDRIKILLGRSITTQSEIYTNHNVCEVLGSTAKTYVAPLIKRKEKGGLVMMSPLGTQEQRDSKLKDILK